MMEQAQAIDRRRQAQIANQKASITRLLNASIRDDDTVTPEARYTEEMGILHTATAESVARSEELTVALRQLADAVAQTLPGSAWSDDIDAAIQEATRLIGPMTVSVAVRESKASVG